MTNFHRYFLVVGVPLVIPLQSFGAENFSEIVLLSCSQEIASKVTMNLCQKNTETQTQTEKKTQGGFMDSNQAFFRTCFGKFLGRYCHCLVDFTH